MSTYRYLMFKMRDFMQIKHKITHFKHFAGVNSKFFWRIVRILEFFS